MKRIFKPLEIVGKTLIAFITEFGCISMLLYNSLRLMFIPPFEFRMIFAQMYEVGTKSFPVVFITAIFSGMVLALQTLTGFKFIAQVGAQSLVGTVVALSITRELAPVLTGLIVAGRAGAAMAAELGTMKVSEEIDALETLATNPIKYLIIPRLIAGVVMLPTLTILADFVGILGGFFVSVYIFDASSVGYWNRTWDYLEIKDITDGLIKACFFGASISIVSCYKGFYTTGGAKGVGQATTGAVVLSSMAILVSDYFISVILAS
ncbi:MAG: ABC transporter permease [Nitrospirae bacterium]|nr:ABC transporter permease [Nitrospirota bacterium]